LQIKARVVFLGKVQNVDLLMSESAIFVLPSRLEGFPNALCEAMAFGIPSICFDSIPVEALLTSGKDGIVVAENDIDSLAVAMKELINNPSLRNELGNNAKKIKDKLAVATIGKQVFDFMFASKK
jgi:glycosyltransferase involved in cell wall biosynthesis